jgi:hypothetical protein
MPNGNMMINLRRIRWLEHTAHIGERRNAEPEWKRIF